MEESYPMTGGDGANSYARNSNKQKEGAEMAKAMLAGGIIEYLDMAHATSNLFTIADLGCSTGPNTFIAVDNIMEGITQKLKLNGYSTLPEFQVFFSDHASNDFNILFANLPPNRNYFVAAVPGSFHRRLFPKASINFVYSAFALQWLSKMPQELGDLNSPACNRGRIYYTNAPDEVGQAYSLQYAKDIGSFLAARAEEVAPGGLMTLLIPGRPNGTLPSQVSLGPVFDPLESCLLDMANEGMLSRDKIDSFNLPIYSPSIEELTALVQNHGCFSIARLVLLPQKSTVTLPTAGELRGGLESIIRKHFGSEIIEQLFQRYAKKTAGHTSIRGNDDIAMGLFVLLKRNY